MIWTIIHTAVETVGWIFLARLALAALANKLDEWDK